jgi:hypothetical protein
MEGWMALEGATDAYVEALAYFKGEAPERFANRRVRQLVEESGQTYQFRLAAKPVSVMTKRCRIATVTADTDAVKARLEEIRKANQASIYEPLVIRKTFTFGDAFVMVWPVDPEEEGVRQVDGEAVDVAAEEELADAGVELSYQSPLHCRVMYDAQDGRRARYAIRRWHETGALGKVWRAEVHYADRVEPWVTKPGASGGTAEEWMPYAEDEEGESLQVEEGEGGNWPLDNPWGELAIKHFRTDLPYGEPAHAAAYGPQDAITKAVTTQVVVDLEAHGWPERYRLLDDQKLLETGQEPVAWGDSTKARQAFPDEPAHTGRRRGSGLEHTYAGTRAVGEFGSPDPGALIAPIDQWLRLMSVVTETPLDELDPTVQLSGISREKADAPARDKEREAKAYLEGSWVEVYSLAVRMSGLEPGTIAVTWAPPEVTMDADWWTTAQIRMNLGVPIRQILAEANYLPDQIDAWLDTQGEEMALTQRIANLERLGVAIQSLGVAVQLGVLDAGTVGSLVQRVVGEIQSGDSGGTRG